MYIFRKDPREKECMGGQEIMLESRGLAMLFKSGLRVLF